MNCEFIGFMVKYKNKFCSTHTNFLKSLNTIEQFTVYTMLNSHSSFLLDTIYYDLDCDLVARVNK